MRLRRAMAYRAYRSHVLLSISVHKPGVTHAQRTRISRAINCGDAASRISHHLSRARIDIAPVISRL